MRQGQFFMIGVLLLSGIILAAVSLQSGVSATTQADAISRTLFEQTFDEFRQTVATAVRQEATSARIAMHTATYMDFTRRIDNEQGISSRSYFIVGLPVDSGVNVTVGNYWRDDLTDIQVTVDNETAQISSLAAANTTTLRFNTTDPTFRVELDIAERQHSFTTSRKVFSLFHTRARSGSTVRADTEIS